MNIKWITVKQAAAQTEYNEEYIRRLVRLEKINAQKFGHMWQIDEASLLDYLQYANESADKRRRPK